MKQCFSIIAALAAILICSCQPSRSSERDLDSVASPSGTDIYKADLDSIAARYSFPQWYTDAKFGIFIHWGVYSVPAFGNEWYPHNMYQRGSDEYEHHRQTYGDQHEFGYKDFIPMFKAENFDADQWAALFEASGARYVIPVAEHHDGFSMYDSQLNPWNAKAMGPERDIIGELKQAIEAHNMVFGVSSHRAENAWYYFGGMEFPSDVQDTTISLYGFRYDREAYTETSSREWLERTYEIVDKYQPRLIFFDWTVNNPVIKPWFTKFLAYYYNSAVDWGEGVVVNTKQGYPTDVMVWDVERGKSGHMMQFPWQTDTFVGTKSWGYIEDEVYKTPDQIVDDLVDIVSKNGNLLLNIGPRADGTIPEEARYILLAIGNWLEVNGEAIYGSHTWKRHGEGETVSTMGSFTDNKAVEYTPQDIRFTTRGNDFYAITLEWGAKDVLIHSLTPDVIGDAELLSVKMLGSDEEISCRQQPDGLLLSFPKTKPCDFAYTFRLSFDRPIGRSLHSEAINEVMKHGE